MDHKVLLSFASVLLYLFPSVLAAARDTAERGHILLLNVLLGWTVIGWCAALVIAITGKTRRQLERRKYSQTLEMIWAHRYE